MAVAVVAAACASRRQWGSGSRCSTARRSSGWTTDDGTPGQLEGRGRRHHVLRAGLAPVQPARRLQELPLPRRDQDQRQRQLGHVLPDREGPRLPARATRPRSTAPTATRSRPARSTTTSRSMDMLVPPDTWFTQEIEAVGNHIVIKVNGKTHGRLTSTRRTASRRATSPSSSTTRAARSRSARSRSWSCPRRCGTIDRPSPCGEAGRWVLDRPRLPDRDTSPRPKQDCLGPDVRRTPHRPMTPCRRSDRGAGTDGESVGTQIDRRAQGRGGESHEES